MRYSNKELASMTSDQLGEIRKNLPSALQYNTPGVWSEEDKYLDTQLRCLSMIDSCLTYQTGFMTPQPNQASATNNGSYANRFLDRLKGKDVRELYDCRKAYFDNHVRIIHGVDTDSEGITYNTIEEY